MDERKIAKDSLKKGYLKELPEEITKSLAVENQTFPIRNMRFDEDGILHFTPIGPPEACANVLVGIINYLASELAETKAELWLKTKSNKESQKP